MKKGVFSLMNYLLPKMGILSLHSGCNEGKQGDVTLFFGLSGGWAGGLAKWWCGIGADADADAAGWCL